MGKNNIVCTNGNTECYYVNNTPWQVWGRWLMLGCLVVFIIGLIIFSGWMMSLRRMKMGLPPITGFDCCLPNPYRKQGKHLKSGLQAYPPPPDTRNGRGGIVTDEEAQFTGENSYEGEYQNSSGERYKYYPPQQSESRKGY